MRFQAILIAATVLLSGCMKSISREETPVLKFSRTEVSVPAMSYAGAVRDTLFVTCNRSWTVRLQDPCDWLELSTDGCENPSGTTVTVPLVLTFANNEIVQDRTAGLRFFTEGMELAVPVRQLAFVPPPPVDSVSVNGIDNYEYEDFGIIP